MYQFQVWFQNRRAKFRRNERNILSQRNSLYGRPMESPGTAAAANLEQPIAARPTAVNTADYLSWSSGPYGGISNPSYCSMNTSAAMAAAAMQSSCSPNNTSSSCALAGNTSPYSAATPPGVGTSLANLRLKAREYNLHQSSPGGYGISPSQMTS